MDFRTDRARVSGLGSAKDGTHHFWIQRVTAVALVPLTLLFVFTFAGALGADHGVVLQTYSSPWNAIVAILFIVTALYHAQLGLQVVIEDYIHGPLRMPLILANILFTWGLALAGVFAVAKIAFTA